MGVNIRAFFLKQVKAKYGVHIIGTAHDSWCNCYGWDKRYAIHTEGNTG